MDARRLSDAKGMLKRRASADRSKPLIEDAAHPGSAGVLRQISVGHFDLHHTATNDRSKPMVDADVHVKANPATEVFKELTKESSRSSLKSPKIINDRSDPVIEKFPTGITTRKPPQKAVVAQIAAEKATIEAFSEINARHSVESIEKAGFVHHDLAAEIKACASTIGEQNSYHNEHTVPEMNKHVHVPLVAEIKRKSQSIRDFGEYAARHSGDTAAGEMEIARSAVNPSLVGEIKQKRASIDALTHLHNVHSAKTTEVA